MDGVALLSEALSSGSEGAKYRELGRLLELAFGLSLYDPRLKTTLAAYFNQAPGYGYDSDEIGEWVALRHPTTHADLQRTKWIALGADVRHVVLRMQQACLDILFNKLEWRSASNARRHLWQPDAVTTTKDGNLVVRVGTKNLSTLLRAFDEFGVHPRILEVVVDHSKDSLYAQFAQDDAAMGKSLTRSPGEADA